ncbi:MAG TPA: thioredoxin family protein [Candidatus Acidoferrum sp.]|nr:thioredoxin family protein [Candidatus Acidoferrum sp.]
MTTTTLERPRIASPADWLAARKALLKKEKELTHLRDALAVERQALPWVRVEKNYVFDAPGGKKSLADLFGSRSQLAVYHFMFGPEWPEGCPSCSMVGDGIDGVLPHLLQRDVTFTAVSRAPLPKLEAFKTRMGWRFPWASSSGNTFNQDFRVSFTPEELASGKIYNYGTVGFPAEEAPGLSVFAKDPSGNVYHTYSTFGRGLEELLGVYFFLDRVPNGRDEANQKPHPMGWVRHHDKYPEAEPARATTANIDAGCCHSDNH